MSSRVNIGGTFYYVFSQGASYAEAQGQCRACIGTDLANVNSATVLSLPPGVSAVCSIAPTANWDGQTWIGRYEGQLPSPGTGFILVGNAIGETSDLDVGFQFWCDSFEIPAPPTPPCMISFKLQLTRFRPKWNLYSRNSWRYWLFGFFDFIYLQPSKIVLFRVPWNGTCWYQLCRRTSWFSWRLDCECLSCSILTLAVLYRQLQWTRTKHKLNNPFLLQFDFRKVRQ